MNRQGIDNPWAVAGMSLALALAMWAVVAAPLPAHFTDGIPYSARTDPVDQVLVMKSGDHLQLLYHFWLAADMIGGGTPWFHNLYEFNTGDDSERFEPGSYYAPFSLVYAAARPVLGDAGGWNMAGLASVWLACFCTWLLARRYTTSTWIAAAAGAVAILFPYPWFALFGGSPTGFAVSLVPMTLLGLDLAVRDDRVGGGILAGAGVLLAASADPHVLFFTGLTMPAWCVFALIARAGFARSSPRAWGRLALALVPAVLGGLLALGLAQLTAGALADSHIAGGRSLAEIRLFSSRAKGFTSWLLAGEENQVYLGVVLLVAMGVGVPALLWQAGRDAVLLRGPRSEKSARSYLRGDRGRSPSSSSPPQSNVEGGRPRPLRSRAADGLPPQGPRRVLLALLLVAGFVAVLLLALGPNGPFESRVFLAARKLIPPYRMIRQPAKVLCLAPVLCAVTVALVLPAVAKLFRGGRFARALLAVVLVAAMAVEIRAFLQPGICVLDTEQGAYAAVAQDAAGRDQAARLLVVTLWPGDSDYASVYQHYVRLYRLRMLNGYRPLISPDYLERIFTRFESANLGLLEDGQLDELLGRGVHYIVSHEDLFPEKVSPFPVAHTLSNLEAHPRLTRIGADGAVRAYRIETEPHEARQGGDVACSVYFPARRWEAERERADGGRAVTDHLASSGAFHGMSAGDHVRLRSTAVMPAPGMRYLLRARGKGTLRVVEATGGEIVGDTVLQVNGDEWAVLEVEAAAPTGYAMRDPEIRCEDGAVDLDVVLLAAGDRVQPIFIGNSVKLPAACFFHAGYTEAGGEAVHLRPDRDPGRELLYGPKLPLDTGTYMVLVETDGEGATSLPVGRIDVRWSNGDTGPGAIVLSSGSAELVFEQEHNLPVFLVFTYNRAAEVAIRTVTLSRIGL